jgi:hypothetical protein
MKAIYDGRKKGHKLKRKVKSLLSCYAFLPCQIRHIDESRYISNMKMNVPSIYLFIR